MTHNLFYPLGWFYHFLSQTFFSASEIARWPQTLRREINFTNETRKNGFFLKGLYLSSFTFHTVNLDTKKKHSPFLFSRWVWEWLGLFARRLSTQSRVQSKFIPGNKFRASYWWGKLSRDDASTQQATLQFWAIPLTISKKSFHTLIFCVWLDTCT